MLRDVEAVGPAGERLTVVHLAKLPVLPDVDEFVSDRLAELFPAELLVGVPGEPNRDRFARWVVFGHASLSLAPFGNLPVNRFDGELGEVLGSDVGRMRSRSVEQGCLGFQQISRGVTIDILLLHQQAFPQSSPIRMYEPHYR